MKLETRQKISKVVNIFAETLAPVILIAGLGIFMWTLASIITDSKPYHLHPTQENPCDD